MTTVPPTTSSSASQSSTSSASSASDALNNIDLGTFLTLMIKELQNQDPLNPMDNSQILTQLSQIRSIGASDKLTQTLNSVLLGQNISSATNLIGAQVTALSDTNESVTGVVDRVSIDNGTPKLHIENPSGLTASTDDGNIGAGTYSYRVVWADDNGKLLGLDFSGSQAIATTGTANKDRSIELVNLPATTGPKQVYRTDSSGTGAYQLVGTITNGNLGSFEDTLADSERSGTTLTQDFQRASGTSRSYDVSLSNVSSITPPGVNASP